MSSPRVCVEVSDNYLWALRPFAYLFNIYWSELQPVVVFGYSPPDFLLPPNFTFYSIDRKNYPAERWSNGFIRFLDNFPDDYFVWLLADYWLSRTVDVGGVRTMAEYMAQVDNCVRFDLTGDRLYSGRAFDIGAYGHYDLIETPSDTPYQFSMQAAIWRKNLLRSLIIPDRSPWEVEIYTSIPPEMRVLGSRQMPIRYANGVLKGKIDKTQIALIPENHRSIILSMIPQDKLGD